MLLVRAAPAQSGCDWPYGGELTIYVNASSGLDTNNGLFAAQGAQNDGPLRRIYDAFQKLTVPEVPAHPAFQATSLRIVLTGGTYFQTAMPGLKLGDLMAGGGTWNFSDQEQFPIVVPVFVHHVSIEAQFPYVAAIHVDMSQQDELTPHAPEAGFPLFRISPDTELRLKDFRIAARGDPSIAVGDWRDIVDFGFCATGIGGLCQPCTSGCTINFFEPADGRVLFEGMRLEVDRLVAGSFQWEGGVSGQFSDNKMRICILDSTVEFQRPDDIDATTVPPTHNTPIAVNLKLEQADHPKIDVISQRSRLVDGGFVAFTNGGSNNAKLQVHGFNSHFRDYQAAAVTIPNFGPTPEPPVFPPVTKLKLWHCDFRTTKTDGTVQPPALVLQEDFTAGSDSIFNCILAGNSHDIEGVFGMPPPFPPNLDWDGIATTDAPGGTFQQDVSGTKKLNVLSTTLYGTFGEKVWFADPLDSQGQVDTTVARLEAHVKPIPEILDQGVVLNYLVHGALTVYREPRDGISSQCMNPTIPDNVIPDIGADEAWLYRVWKIQDPIYPTPGKLYLRAMAPYPGAAILGLYLALPDASGLQPALPPLGFDPCGPILPFLPPTVPMVGELVLTGFATFGVVTETPLHAMAELPGSLAPGSLPPSFYVRFQAALASFDPMFPTGFLSVNESAFWMTE